MHRLEILDRSSSTQIEQVLPRADVARLAALAGGDMRKRVLDGHALTEHCAAGGGLLQLAELLLERLVLGDRHTAAPAGRGLGAARAERASSADLGVEVDGLAGLEAFHLTCGARDGLRA